MMNDVYEKFLKSSEEFIFAENKPEKSDIIFVPGNGYPQMAEKAAELFKKGMADWILPSGKYSVVNGKFSGVLEKSNVYDKEYGTEWEFLRDVLIKNGVPDQKILKEDQATFTYENAIYSRQVTDHAELEIERFKGLTILSPNETETEALVGILPKDDETCIAASKILKERSDCKYVVLKMGDKGSFIYGDDICQIVPTFKVEAVEIGRAHV